MDMYHDPPCLEVIIGDHRCSNPSTVFLNLPVRHTGMNLARKLELLKLT
jgi:hypothetical protein